MVYTQEEVLVQEQEARKVVCLHLHPKVQVAVLVIQVEIWERLVDTQVAVVVVLP
jgi:hypothetical protein